MLKLICPCVIDAKLALNPIEISNRKGRFKRIGDTEKVQLGPATGAQAAAAVATYCNEGTLKIPGTVALVGVFFVSFVLYYYVNWKYLAELWPLK